MDAAFKVSQKSTPIFGLFVDIFAVLSKASESYSFLLKIEGLK